MRLLEEMPPWRVSEAGYLIEVGELGMLVVANSDMLPQNLECPVDGELLQ
jgi:hypothetical protein